MAVTDPSADLLTAIIFVVTHIVAAGVGYWLRAQEDKDDG